MHDNIVKAQSHYLRNLIRGLKRALHYYPVPVKVHVSAKMGKISGNRLLIYIYPDGIPGNYVHIDLLNERNVFYALVSVLK